MACLRSNEHLTVHKYLQKLFSPFVPILTASGGLNVGDQILVCDGVSLIDVTHDEAAQALKRAMDMESVRPGKGVVENWQSGVHS